MAYITFDYILSASPFEANKRPLRHVNKSS